MNVRRAILLLLVVPLMVLLAACEFSASTANIASAILARDEAGTEPTTNFSPTDTFYLLVDLANAPDDTAVRAVWYAVDVGDVAPANTLIDEATLTSGSATLTFDLVSDTQWPPGTYRVELYLNDELNQTLDFSVAE
jgi:hypothetical protein